ncbi:uncharacterized mitochondrial protein AtMg00860-like [Gossypium raimondii]|uniref:uncharacterized mitochondrial protein AtMg00860-like n=1 Tax=Gossypium raimondii TaxID=29730 RepID=UPI00227BDFC4|nr:uncharacterized mitochondrial protein AtMg00860-like [Gossypium raimondii]
MDQSNVNNLFNWPKPRSTKELRSFLRLSGYYRRFIQGYETIAKPLIKLLKKKEWVWTMSIDEAFQALKVAISSAHILVLSDFDKEFCVDTDASDIRAGAVLHQ